MNAFAQVAELLGQAVLNGCVAVFLLKLNGEFSGPAVINYGCQLGNELVGLVGIENTDFGQHAGMGG